MKIGILGTGNIGKTLVQKLSAAGHDVKVANSRVPETIAAELLSAGARAVTQQEALVDVDVVILSIPLNRLSSEIMISQRPAEATDRATERPFGHVRRSF